MLLLALLKDELGDEHFSKHISFKNTLAIYMMVFTVKIPHDVDPLLNQPTL